MAVIVLTPTQHRIYRWFCETQAASAECPPNVGDVAVAIGYNYVATYRTLSELCAVGLLSRSRIDCRHSYVYSLLDGDAEIAEKQRYIPPPPMPYVDPGSLPVSTYEQARAYGY